LFLTICTPTFNRGYTLTRLYNSLISQSINDFEWVIIDDGSTDNTKELIQKWMKDRKININYHYQENYGKHVALNKGIEKANGKVFTCLDSDDWYCKDTVEKIKHYWSNVELDENLVGIITLDCFESGEIIGTEFPNDLMKTNWIDLQFKYKVKGDKDYYFNKEVLLDYKFPEIEGNKHMPPSYQYFMLSEKYNFLLINEPTKYVEYMEDGISRNKLNKYIIAPDNFAYYRLSIMNLIPSFKRKLVNAIHFNSSLYIGNLKLKPKAVRNKILVLITKPFGYVLSKYIKLKTNIK
jgi:glycosyltransferase involved in cell wall biosynthesis